VSAEHNHPPRCCCDVPPGDMPTEDADPTYLCPGCPEHGAFAYTEEHSGVFSALGDEICHPYEEG
jgi:hypothetical protein